MKPNGRSDRALELYAEHLAARERLRAALQTAPLWEGDELASAARDRRAALRRLQEHNARRLEEDLRRFERDWQLAESHRALRRFFLSPLFVIGLALLAALLLLGALAAFGQQPPARREPCARRGADGWWRIVPCGTAEAQPLEHVDALIPRDAYELAAPAILRVDGPTGARSGTAVCVGERLAATAAHVIKPLSRFRVVWQSGDLDRPDLTTEWFKPAGAFLPHREYDVAIVPAPPCEPARIAPQDARLAPGTGVFIVGYPYPDWAKHARWGRIGSRPAGRWLMTDLPTDHGDSGSGLFNERGELVAICQGKSTVGAPFIDARILPPLIEEALELRRMGRFAEE